MPRDSSPSTAATPSAGTWQRSPAICTARSRSTSAAATRTHRQIEATHQRVPGAEILTFPGGHLTTSEHPELLAAAIRDIAGRHGVGIPAAADDVLN
jgi:pimeloyl-ACP methyl ester carboxylesterase